MNKSNQNWLTESFKIEVDTFNHKLNLKEKINLIEQLDFLPFRGKIDLKSPTNIFHLIKCYETEKSIQKPTKIYFAKHLINGNRKLITELELSKRKLYHSNF